MGNPASAPRATRLANTPLPNLLPQTSPRTFLRRLHNIYLLALSQIVGRIVDQFFRSTQPGHNLDLSSQVAPRLNSDQVDAVVSGHLSDPGALGIGHQGASWNQNHRVASRQSEFHL